jgi:hypothetical protein
MDIWLLILAAPATVILWRVIGVAATIWRERARVTARCVQMDAAASSGAVLCERLPDGTTLLVMPGTPGPERAPSAEAVPAAVIPAAVIPAVRKPAA